MDDEDYIDAVADDCERILNIPFDDLIVAVIETKYPWLKKGRIVWARTPEWTQALFWVLPDEEPMHLNGPQGLSYVSRMLVESTGPLPRGLSPTKLAETIRQLTFDPRGQVTSREFLHRVRPHIGYWLAEDDDDNRRLFEGQCEDPTILNENGTWILKFRSFNTYGGVEQWIVTGTPAHIVEAQSALMYPKGTFIWPMA
jgi:hypothetical protein